MVVSLNPNFLSEDGHRRPAVLNVSADLRRRNGVGAQIKLLDARPYLTNETPHFTLIPSYQSSETKHDGMDPYRIATAMIG